MIRKFYVLAAFVLSGCASGERLPAAPHVATTVDLSTAEGAASYLSDVDYRIGPADKLAMRVFQLEDLTFSEIFVDASGNLQLPLLGSVRAAGLTPAELSTEIERRLRAEYLRDPHVVVTVSAAASQKITVDGAVKKSGVYEMRGRTTLMQAVAMAEGTTNIAALDSVAVFRTVNDRRMVAVFDLAAIRGGQEVDPVMQGDDVVVVDTSRLSANVRDFLSALPGLGVFRYF